MRPHLIAAALDTAPPPTPTLRYALLPAYLTLCEYNTPWPPHASRLKIAISAPGGGPLSEPGQLQLVTFDALADQLWAWIAGNTPTPLQFTP